MPTKDEVMEALTAVMDPEIGVNIVDLGLVYNVEVAGEDTVNVSMTMTTFACPLADYIVSQVYETLGMKFGGLHNIHVNLVWDPPWTPDKMSENAKLILGR